MHPLHIQADRTIGSKPRHMRCSACGRHGRYRSVVGFAEAKSRGAFATLESLLSTGRLTEKFPMNQTQLASTNNIPVHRRLSFMRAASFPISALAIVVACGSGCGGSPDATDDESTNSTASAASTTAHHFPASGEYNLEWIGLANTVSSGAFKTDNYAEVCVFFDEKKSTATAGGELLTFNMDYMAPGETSWQQYQPTGKPGLGKTVCIAHHPPPGSQIRAHFACAPPNNPIGHGAGSGQCWFKSTISVN
jgi:hypothetical protein